MCCFRFLFFVSSWLNLKRELGKRLVGACSRVSYTQTSGIGDQVLQWKTGFQQRGSGVMERAVGFRIGPSFMLHPTMLVWEGTKEGVS